MYRATCTKRKWVYQTAKKGNHCKTTSDCSEVVVKGEVAAVLALGLVAGCGRAVILRLLGAGHDAGLLVFAHALLKEVGLAAERDVLHEVERVADAVDL